MAVKVKKIKETDELYNWFPYRRTLADMGSMVDVLREKYGDEAVIFAESYYDSSEVDYYVKYERDETVEERDKRLKKAASSRKSAKKAAATKKENKLLEDRKEFVRLTNLFADD